MTIYSHALNHFVKVLRCYLPFYLCTYEFFASASPGSFTKSCRKTFRSGTIRSAASFQTLRTLIAHSCNSAIVYMTPTRIWIFIGIANENSGGISVRKFKASCTHQIARGIVFVEGTLWGDVSTSHKWFVYLGYKSDEVVACSYMENRDIGGTIVLKNANKIKSTSFSKWRRVTKSLLLGNQHFNG